MPKRSPSLAWFLAPALAVAGLGAFPSGPLPSPASAAATAGAGIVTFHYDEARTGWDPAERVLTSQALRSRPLRRLWSEPVDGDIYASPVIVSGVAVRGQPKALVYVVTERDTVYAFDAASGGRVWGPVSVGTSVPRSSLPCGNIDPVGITGTPVADPSSGLLFAAALTSSDGGRTRSYRVAALDLATGAEHAGWPVTLDPPASNGLKFDVGPQQERGALTFLHGVVYVPFGGYWGDCGDYHGWIVAVPVASPAKQEAYATPTTRRGGIWAHGGMAADGEGRLYAGTGNSDSGGRVDFGEAVLRLETSPSLRFSAASRDYFVPSNFVSLNDTDSDLGSGTPIVLPDQPGTSTPHLVFAAGKQGVAYLINRDDMGGVSKGNGVAGEGVYSRCVFGACGRGGFSVFSAPAYWDGGAAGRFVYVPGPGRGAQPEPCRGSGGIVALRLGVSAQSHTSTLDVAWCSPAMRDAGAPAVTGSGSNGVVWVIDTAEGTLHAFDARSGASLVGVQNGEAIGAAHRFITPAVFDGRVYVGAAREVVAYGLK
ncbi:MAG TPA: PQQ-binding-like beta-propeller repeat protein [bacterium]|nr:PQQ-binding-like beta-propeller repeat protein [bacterium]